MNDIEYQHHYKKIFKIEIDCLRKIVHKETELLRGLVQDETEETHSIDIGEHELVPIPISCIPIHLPLPCPLYIALGKRFVMLRRQCDEITSQQMMTFQQKKISSFYIHKSFWAFFKKDLEGMKLSDDMSSPETRGHVQKLLESYGKEIEKRTNNDKKYVLKRLEEKAYSLADKIYQYESLEKENLLHSSDPFAYFSNHAVNCAIFAAHIGKSQKYSLKRLRTLTFAALVHDIGNVFIPRRILYKKSGLTNEEREMINSHTVQGAALLQSVGAPAEVIAVAYQHHERVNGRGYPRNLKGDQLHPFAKIVAIVDVYDALISDRPYQQRADAQEAIEMMKANEGFFEPQYLATI